MRSVFDSLNNTAIDQRLEAHREKSPRDSEVGDKLIKPRQPEMDVAQDEG